MAEDTPMCRRCYDEVDKLFPAFVKPEPGADASGDVPHAAEGRDTLIARLVKRAWLEGYEDEHVRDPESAWRQSATRVALDDETVAVSGDFAELREARAALVAQQERIEETEAELRELQGVDAEWTKTLQRLDQADAQLREAEALVGHYKEDVTRCKNALYDLLDPLSSDESARAASDEALAALEQEWEGLSCTTATKSQPVAEAYRVCAAALRALRALRAGEGRP